MLAAFATSRPAFARLDDSALCQVAVSASEQAGHLPARMLGAIALVESGRADPGTGAAVPWPWTINVAGAGYVFASKDEAIAAVRTAQLAGARSIDVGCMQVNLLYHPKAFASLEEAFDPTANARYATSFLQQLRVQTKGWGAAVAAYHSLTPELGAAYSQRVAKLWPLAGSYGLPVSGAGSSVRMNAPALGPVTDPHHVLTPEFRAKLERESAFRHARDSAMGLLPASSSGDALARQPHIHVPNAERRLTVEARLGG